MAATGVIFIDQKVLLQFAEIQHLTHLDANKQILLLVQLFHCVKSFEIHIKDPEVTPEQSVIKDFFHKLCTIVTGQPKEDNTNHTDSAVLKNEPLTRDVSDNVCPDQTDDLPKHGLLDSTDLKDELNTAALPSSSEATPSQVTFESAKQEHSRDTTSTLTNDATVGESGKNCCLINGFAVSEGTFITSIPKANSRVRLADVAGGPSVVDSSETKILNSGIRKSARHTRLPVKLNSDEFVGLEDATAKPVNQCYAVKSLDRSTHFTQGAEPKVAKLSTTKTAKQQKAKLTKQTINAKTNSNVVKSDLSEKPTNISLTSPKQASRGRDVLKSLKSIRKPVGRPRKHKAIDEQLQASSTEMKNIKTELLAKEDTDISIVKQENTETAELQYTCAVCGLKFGEMSEYVDHVTAHPTHTADDLVCRECGRRLKTKAAFVQHQRSHAAKTIRDVSCPTCGKVFLKKKYLKPHMLRHQGEKNVLCDSCPARFYDRKGLYIHYNRVHLGKVRHLEKKFFCGFCPFKSCRKRDIDRHAVVHTKTKNYVCDICGARLAHFTSLSIHKRIHSAKKLFKCNICQKEFSQKISLQNHERIHTGERPYKCDQCCRGFQTSSHLSRHKITHSQELLFPCKLCDRYFARPFQVKKHIKESHASPDLDNQTVTYEFIKVEADPEDVVLQDQLVCGDDDIQYESIVIEYMN